MVLAIKLYMLEIRCVLTLPKRPRAFPAPPRELAGEISFFRGAAHPKGDAFEHCPVISQKLLGDFSEVCFRLLRSWSVSVSEKMLGPISIGTCRNVTLLRSSVCDF